MRKVALVFVIAVIAPSLVLAWLALGSLRDQELVIERQQTLLYQAVVDAVAAKVRAGVDETRAEFQSQVVELLRSVDLKKLSAVFDTELRARWPAADIGFVVALDGDVLAPSMFGGTEARRFRIENDHFLCSRESVEVYWNSPKGAINLTKLDRQEPGETSVSEISGKEKATRSVMPEKELFPDAFASKLAPEAAAFREIVRNGESGTMARFLQDELNVLFWYRPPLHRPLVFGARVNLARLVEKVKGALVPEPSLHAGICVALINAAGQPVALTHPGFQPPVARLGEEQRLVESIPVVAAESLGRRADWSRPFVATEVGEVLPHWEIAGYLTDPRQLGRTATLTRVTVGLLITVLVLAIAVGSWLIVGDLKRQLALARQKTDFVSNVSHELKTPLTSIRMFSEMLAEGRIAEEPKRRQFLNIITAETARLTRLINNVLDFARLERGEKRPFSRFDLRSLAHETVELYRPHLEAGGFHLESRLGTGLIPVRGDRDGLAQVMVNLLSNAEKYSGDRKEIEVTLKTDAGGVELSVLDRGRGVPPDCEEKIFEQFFRAHDSLASGIQGSGLGLTLARQIATAHGGGISYRPREGGGSCFILRLPVEVEPPPAEKGPVA